jgi:predicted  nucleic acid-binding Zn-ribbon protein
LTAPPREQYSKTTLDPKSTKNSRSRVVLPELDGRKKSLEPVAAIKNVIHSAKALKDKNKKELLDIQNKISEFNGNTWGGDTRIQNINNKLKSDMLENKFTQLSILNTANVIKQMGNYNANVDKWLVEEQLHQERAQAIE